MGRGLMGTNCITRVRNLQPATWDSRSITYAHFCGWGAVLWWWHVGIGFARSRARKLEAVAARKYLALLFRLLLSEMRQGWRLKQGVETSNDRDFITN